MPKTINGREVPKTINELKVKPFKGHGKTLAAGHKYGARLKNAPPRDGKLLGSIEEAIKRTGLKDGMTVSFHHHLRNGDYVINTVMQKIQSMGFKKIRVLPSALFPAQAPLIPLLKDGTIRGINGSMNGPLGAFTSEGGMKDTALLRSHSGRGRAIECGEEHINVAFLAASAADMYGNMNGVDGKSAFGPMSFAQADSRYADYTVCITDNLVPFPCVPHLISQELVDYVVPVESIGDPNLIVSGTTRMTRSPVRLLIAKYAAEVIERIAMKDGFAFQTGSGGISLACTKMLEEKMRKKGIVASFVLGGVTKYTVDMLHEGLTRCIFDGQAFDLAAVRSLRDDHGHIPSDVYQYNNPHTGGGIVHWLDACVLGATEIDIDFNVNVNTHSDGYLLHGIGGHQDAAADSALTIITVPLFRSRIPIIRDSVTTITTPGEVVDVIVTERGIAVNPKRDDVLAKLKRSKLPVMDIQELKKIAYDLCGKPEEPNVTEEVIAGIQWIDGTLIDVVYKVKGKK